ncbi:hypothetical protein [Actinomadura fibrosa]|uniref:Uncharacterized protein n=1 Tax=Actinomadura fibrosa TaxID=111802 RepID=A0ABW2XP80_9ACTN|nr:hypothetical protein [Actinomadura fibrosa]
MPARIVRGDYGIHQLASHLGLSPWQLRLGREHGIVPAPDLDGERWSPALVDKAEDAGARVTSTFGEEPPIGSAKAAARLAARVGLDVERGDVEVLVARGDLNVVSKFRGHPVYLLRDLDRLDADEVRAVVSARKGPLTDSVDASGASMILDWPRKIFDRIAVERDLASDQLGRYALSDIKALSADQDLVSRVTEERRRLFHDRLRKSEIKVEDLVRTWLLQCTAYVDRELDHPPDTAPLGRTLRALVTARAESARHDPGVA